MKSLPVVFRLQFCFLYVGARALDLSLVGVWIRMFSSSHHFKHSSIHHFIVPGPELFTFNLMKHI